MNVTTRTAPGFVAWWRASGREPWQRIAEGATGHALRGRLKELTEGRGGESVVLPEGRSPGETAARPFVGGGRRCF